jgi:hypothetical protein
MEEVERSASYVMHEVLCGVEESAEEGEGAEQAEQEDGKREAVAGWEDGGGDGENDRGLLHDEARGSRVADGGDDLLYREGSLSSNVSYDEYGDELGSLDRYGDGYGDGYRDGVDRQQPALARDMSIIDPDFLDTDF